MKYFLYSWPEIRRLAELSTANSYHDRGSQEYYRNIFWDGKKNVEGYSCLTRLLATPPLAAVIMRTSELVTFVDYNLTSCLRLMSFKCFSTCSSPHYLLYSLTPTEDPFAILTPSFLNIQKILPETYNQYVLCACLNRRVSAVSECLVLLCFFLVLLVFYSWPWTCNISANSIC